MTDTGRFTVLDLFSGAGGMALGFEAAGCRCVGAVEKDTSAAETFRTMFAHDAPVVFGGPEQGDVNHLNASDVVGALESPPDIIVGGPPCQGFSRVGRAKQRSLLDEDHIERHGFVLDPGRNELYRFFLDTVALAKPKAFVMENVPGMREHMGVDVAKRIAREAAACGYNVRYFLLNAAWYGVPQHRWRIFFVGMRSDLGHCALPSPPMRLRYDARTCPEGIALPEDPWMVWGNGIPLASNAMPPVTVREAIGDLPKQTQHLDGIQPKEQRLPYRRRPISDWAERMRRWPNRPSDGQVSGNKYRFTPRDFRIFRQMTPGDCYPEALIIANRLFQDHLRELKHKQQAPVPKSPEWEELRRAFVPPYRNDGSFVDKWHKLQPHEPSWTVTAHLGKDTYSHIHYQSSQARMITVREAARLQSFPDAFEFSGNMGACFRQIGNAVPPLLAQAIAAQLVGQLKAVLPDNVAKK